MPLDKADIQGNILHGYKFSQAAHLFSEIRPDEAARWQEFLRELRPLLTSSEQRFEWTESETALNVGISYQGFYRLHAHSQAPLSVSFAAFLQGMAARSRELGDPPESPEVPWGQWSARHVWISLHGMSSAALRSRIGQLESLARGLNIGATSPLWGQALVDANGNRTEHFGFRDGIANPPIQDTNFRQGDLEGNGKRDANGKWVPIAEGEFILGYPNERNENPLLDLPVELKRVFENGTFAVFRDLEQHVERFEAYMERMRVINPGEDVAAKMIGRKPNGEALAAPGQVVNFHYDEDGGGARCPLGSHVRRSNPREKGVGRHRLVRRGMPYDTRAVKGGRRGMYFVAMNASIENQFEFLQKTWLNGPVGALRNARDPIAACGTRTRRMLIEGDGTREPILLLDIPEFVTCRGGEYYFMPGLRGLELLAGGVAPEPRTATRGLNGPRAVPTGGLFS